MSSKFDDFSNKIDLVSELKNIKNVNEKIITENKRLSDEVAVLKKNTIQGSKILNTPLVQRRTYMI